MTKSQVNILCTSRKPNLTIEECNYIKAIKDPGKPQCDAQPGPGDRPLSGHPTIPALLANDEVEVEFSRTTVIVLGYNV